MGARQQAELDERRHLAARLVTTVLVLLTLAVLVGGAIGLLMARTAEHALGLLKF